jgi:hypothetical protein
VSTIIAEATLQTETQTHYGTSPSVPVVPNGITDAGFIVIELFCDTPWSTAFGPPKLDGGAVLALTVYDDDGTGPNPLSLFAGGAFDFAGGVPTSRVARWDGRTWHPLGEGITTPPSGNPGEVLSLSVLDLSDGNGPALYAMGTFLIAGGKVLDHRVAPRGDHSKMGTIAFVASFSIAAGAEPRVASSLDRNNAACSCLPHAS